MGKQLIVTEKPSVAKDIAKLFHITNRHDGYMESDQYVITWALGHLVTLGLPNIQNPNWQADGKWEMSDLPMLPETFKYVPIAKTKSQLNIVTSLIKRPDITEIINAGDDGREGEYIQRLIYEYANNKKPVLRARFSSMDEKTLRKAFDNLVPGSVMDNIYAAAQSRAKNDWKIGMNFSELICLKNKTYGFSVGRVQTPTVELIRRRNDEIANFVSEPFYLIQANFSPKYHGILVDEEQKQRIFHNTKEVGTVFQKLTSKQGVIKEYSTQRKMTERPGLYNLSKLQIDANRKFGYSAQDVLDIAQALYEKHKITTYPRTDSEYLTDNMKEDLKTLVSDICSRTVNSEKMPFQTEGLLLDRRIFNNGKVSDHHAIIINENYKNYDFSKLSTSEQNVLSLITNSILVVVSPKYEYNQTVVLTDVNGYKFRSVGNTPVKQGFKETQQLLGYFSAKKDEESQELPVLEKEQIVNVVNIERIDKKTNPPKQLTEGDLIKAMLHVGNNIEDKDLKKVINQAKGIGTEATRAGIIAEIIQKEYVEVKKKCFYVTEKGRTLLNIVPERVKDPVMSAEWEFALSEIERGKRNAAEFDKEMDKYIEETIRNYEGKIISYGKSSDAEIVGTCPKCSGNFIKGKFGSYCESKCGFVLNKFRGKELTEAQKKKILDGKSVVVRGLKSKGGKNYNLEITPLSTFSSFEYNGKTYYSLEFETKFAK